MPVRPPECKVPLPKGWSRRVRSAVIRTISLARFALTVAHGQAAKALDARVRLQQDNERLRCELNLLHEESRIKDARMQRIPAQRRPHYPPTERLAILEFRAARGWSVSQTAERFHTCLECHKEPVTNSPEEEKIRPFQKSHKEIPWKRIYEQPDHVFFSPRRHVVLGKLQCQACHGNIGQTESPPSKPWVKMTM